MSPASTATSRGCGDHSGGASCCDEVFAGEESLELGVLGRVVVVVLVITFGGEGEFVRGWEANYSVVPLDLAHAIDFRRQGVLGAGRRPVFPVRKSHIFDSSS